MIPCFLLSLRDPAIKVWTQWKATVKWKQETDQWALHKSGNSVTLCSLFHFKPPLPFPLSRFFIAYAVLFRQMGLIERLHIKNQGKEDNRLEQLEMFETVWPSSGGRIIFWKYSFERSTKSNLRLHQRWLTNAQLRMTWFLCCVNFRLCVVLHILDLIVGYITHNISLKMSLKFFSI